MALNKQQLEVVNQTNFPNNNGQLITPELLRDFNSDMIEAIQLTGSYATTGANTFVGNQTITGNLTVSGVISASVLHVQYETASVIFSTGSNQLGDELSDTQTLSGSVKVQGSLTVNGVPVVTGSVQVDTGSLVTTASFNAYTASNNQRVSSLETNSASVNISITNVNSATASLFTSVNSLNSFTASQKILNGQYATTGSNTFTGNQVIDRASKLYTNGIYWTDVTAGFNNLEIINQGGGNLDFASLNGGKVRFVSSSVNFLNSPISSSNDISTSANIYAANLTGSTLPAGTISSSAQITALGFVSSSVTASSLITASFDNGTRNLTFTKGNNTQFSVNIPDVSGSAGNFVTTSSFNAYTASTDSSISQLNASSASQQISIDALNTNSASVNVSISNLNSTTSSFATSIANLNSFSQSAQTSINALNGATSSYANSASVAAVDAAQQQSINSLNAATSSYATSAITASSLVTASFSGNTLTFTKGDASTFGVVIPDVSGSTIPAGTVSSSAQIVNYGIFATTGSNQFIGNQAIDGTLTITGKIIGSQSIILQPDANDARTLEIYNTSAADTHITASGGELFLGNDETYVLVNTNANQKLVTVRGDQGITASGSLDISGSLTSSLQQGYVLVGNSNNRTSLVATSSYATSAITASSLITASVSLNTITFTKGDGTTFPITVNTGSGGGGSTNTGSLMVTASASGTANTITFTKGDASTFDVTLNITASASASFDTGSFATTGSNTFVGNQTISGSVAVKNILSFPNGLAFSGNAGDVSQISAATTIQLITEPPAGPGGTNDIKFINRVTGSSVSFINEQGGAGNNVYFEAGEVIFNAGIRSGSNGNITFRNTINSIDASSTPITASAFKAGAGGINSAGALTASLQQGYAWVGNSSGVSTLVATSSFGSTINTGSFATTGSNTFVGNQTITSTGNTQINIESTGGPGSNQTNLEFRGNSSNFQAYGDFVINNNGQFGGSGSVRIIATKNNLSIATDDGLKIGATNGGGNGIDNGNISMQVRSGSLSLAPSGISNTTASLSHLSSSSNTANVNLMFKNSSTAADTIISGSNNIFSNPAAATAGFKRYIGGAQNILISGNAIPQISGSMAFSPTMNNNTIVGAGGMIMRGPVSSSAWSIINNLINPTSAYAIGSAAATNAEKIVSGLNITNNNGSVFPNIQAYKTPLSASVNYSTNSGAGTVIMLCNSSSISFNGSISQGGTTINNSYFPVTSSINQNNGFVSVQSTLFIGGNHIFFSGSNSTIFTQPRTINGSIIIGNNSASLNLLSDSGSLRDTAIIGTSLGVTGSNSFQSSAAIPSDWGSAFFGRNNAQDGGRAESAKNVFVVGTGDSTTRKTGFLIDSGSNTFVEGTLNVSGSTTMTGSLILSSSAATELQVIGNSEFTGSLSTFGDVTLTAATAKLELVSATSIFKANNLTGSWGQTNDIGGNALKLNGSLSISPTFEAKFATGSNQQAGTAVLDGANPGTVTVSNSLVTANSIIMVSKQTLANPNGYVAVSSKGAGTFTITSNHNGDTDTVGWFIINNS